MTGMKMSNSRIVVTGMGAVTPIGIGVEQYWENLVAGKCGVEKITRFDTENLPVKIAAEVKDFDALAFMPKKLTREMDVFMQYGYAAAMEALAQAGEPAASPERMGLVVGTGLPRHRTVSAPASIKRSARGLFQRLSGTRRQPR